MTITDRIKQALTVIPGNKTFTINSFKVANKLDDLENDQISKAIRSQPYVQRVGVGKYRVKGRKVN